MLLKLNCWATLGDLRQRGIEEKVVAEGRGVEDGLTEIEPTLYVFDEGGPNKAECGSRRLSTADVDQTMVGKKHSLARFG